MRQAKEAGLNHLLRSSGSSSLVPLLRAQPQDAAREPNGEPLLLLEHRVQQLLQGIQQDRTRAACTPFLASGSRDALRGMVQRLAQHPGPQPDRGSAEVRQRQASAERASTGGACGVGTAGRRTTQSPLHQEGATNGLREPSKEFAVPLSKTGVSAQLTEQQRLLMRLVQQRHRRICNTEGTGAEGAQGGTTMKTPNSRASYSAAALVKEMQVGKLQLQPQMQPSEQGSHNRHPHSSPLPPNVSVSPASARAFDVQPLSCDATSRSSAVLAGLAREVYRWHTSDRHEDSAKTPPRSDRCVAVDARSLPQRAAPNTSCCSRLGCTVAPSGAVLGHGSRLAPNLRCAAGNPLGNAAGPQGSLRDAVKDESTAILHVQQEDKRYGELPGKTAPGAVRALSAADIVGVPGVLQRQKIDTPAGQRQAPPDCAVEAAVCQDPQALSRGQQPQQLLQQAKLLQAALVALCSGKGALSPATLAAAATPTVSLLGRAEEDGIVPGTLEVSARYTAGVERAAKTLMHPGESVLKSTPGCRRLDVGESVYPKHRLLQLGWSVVRGGAPTHSRAEAASTALPGSARRRPAAVAFPAFSTSGKPTRLSAPSSAAMHSRGFRIRCRGKWISRERA